MKVGRSKGHSKGEKRGSGAREEVKVEDSVSKLPPYLTKVENGYQIRIKVVPGAATSEIVGAYGDRLKVRVAAPPEKGKANAALLELLRRLPHVKEATLISGDASPEKIVRVVCEGTWKL